MSTYLPILKADIRNRLLADTGSGGLVAPGTVLLASATAVFDNRAPDQQSFPYIVYRIDAGTQDSGFRTRTFRVEFALDVYVLEQADPAPSYDAMSRGDNICERIIGDWEDQTHGTAPTYGLDRWQPGLSGSGYSASHTIMRSMRESHDPGMLHWVVDFEVMVSKAGA